MCSTVSHQFGWVNMNLDAAACCRWGINPLASSAALAHFANRFPYRVLYLSSWAPPEPGPSYAGGLLCSRALNENTRVFWTWLDITLLRRGVWLGVPFRGTVCVCACVGACVRLYFEAPRQIIVYNIRICHIMDVLYVFCDFRYRSHCPQAGQRPWRSSFY